MGLDLGLGLGVGLSLGLGPSLGLCPGLNLGLGLVLGLDLGLDLGLGEAMTEAEYQAFLSAWENYPSQDNEGYQPDRGSFKSGFFAGVKYMKAENTRLREALEKIARDKSIHDGFTSKAQNEIARAALEEK